MILTLYIVGTLILILIIGKIFRSFQFRSEVKELFSRSNNISDKAFDYKQIADLPKPVQRYFRRVLKEGQPYISYVRLTHDGQFKSGKGKDWMNIKGEQYITAEKPGFIWKGTASIVTARDMFLGDKGRLVVTLLYLINLVDGKGKSFDEGELQRWLAECVWFPTNLLPSERLHWSAIDENSAKLTFIYADLSISFVVTFNESGEITQMETERFMDKERKEPWLGKLADYREINGMIVPQKIEAIWKLEKGDFCYAKFNVKQIEYNKPEKF